MKTIIRPFRLKRNFTCYAEGSVLVEMGKTRVLCTATVQEDVPPFLRGSGTGWITAEYALLPRSTPQRNPRERARGRPDGRVFEIQRLIGRALRAVLIPEHLGERQIILDCDVLQADGGTRTAAINGAYIALVDALRKLQKKGKLPAWPLTEGVCAVSVAKLGTSWVVDPDYAQDSTADVDWNIVWTDSGRLVEIQGSAEKAPYTTRDLQKALVLAKTACRKIRSLRDRLLKTR